MKPRPYVIAGPFKTGSCVAKITYDEKKYIIVKCKEAYGSLKRVENGLNAFVRGGVNNPEGLYFHFYNYVKRHPDGQFNVDILLESDNAYELLKFEQMELNKGLKNRNFMNNQTLAYIPAYNEDNKAYGWIPGHAVLNFNNWLKKWKKEQAAKKRSKARKKSVSTAGDQKYFIPVNQPALDKYGASIET